MISRLASMNLETIKFSLLLCLTISSIKAQEIYINQGPTVIVDGVINQAEWQNSARLSFVQSNGDTTEILFHHDQLNLFFAFSGNLESGQMVFPEVLIDVDHSKSANWEPDDWWFHVSATDCDYQGTYGNYDSCAMQRPDWQAVPNFAPGGPKTDIIEVKIPFSKLNYVFNPFDTLGIAFVLSNTVNIFNTWPTTADRMIPAGWADAILFPSLGAEEIKSPDWSLYPNPASGDLNIHCGSLSGLAKARIYSNTGRLLSQHKVILASGSSVGLQIDVDPGLYILELECENVRTSSLFIVK